MAYIGKSPGTGVRNRFIYTATAAQTTFSGSDDHSRTLSYTDAEFTDVFLNGVKLDKSDYTATSGTSIVLGSGATAGDNLEVLAFDTFSVFSGEFSQDVTIGADLTVDTDTLVVDSTNNRVGIGTTSPSATLELNSATQNAAKLKIGRSTAHSNYLQLDTSGGESQLTAIGAASVYGSMIFSRNNGTTTSESMRIDSSGNVLVGKTSTTNATTTVGFHVQPSGVAVLTRDGAAPLRLSRITSDGEIMSFHKDGTTVGKIESVSGVVSKIILDPRTSVEGVGFSPGSYNATTSLIQPTDGAGTLSDNAMDLGGASARFATVRAGTGSINTSDSNEKQQIASLTAAEITAATSISALFKTYKWNDSVTEKGDNARTHVGAIAQDVQQAMTDAGLDATKYGFFCSDTWWEADESYTDDDGNQQTRREHYLNQADAPDDATEYTRLGLRYAELLAFVGAATEQRLADIETRLTALEAN